MADPMTVERCRNYVAKCDEKGKKRDEVEAIRFLLAELDKARFSDDGQRELTIEGGERWLARWQDVNTSRWPYAVKLLHLYSGLLAWHRGEREKAREELSRLHREAAAFKLAVEMAKETLETKEPL